MKWFFIKIFQMFAPVPFFFDNKLKKYINLSHIFYKFRETFLFFNDFFLVVEISYEELTNH